MTRRTKSQIDLDEAVEALARAIRSYRGGVLDRVSVADLCTTAGIAPRAGAKVVRQHADALYRALGRVDGSTWVAEFTEPVLSDDTISCRAITEDPGEDVVRTRQPALSARAWRMLLHADAVEDAIHLLEPWTKKGSRVPSLEDSITAARALIERGLCREGSGIAWVQITDDGRAFVEAQRERYSMMYPYVTLDTGTETIE